MHKAHFPFLRTIDEFNFTFQTALRLQMLGSYLGPELVTEGRSAIFSGPSGTGKSHLCIAIAYRAIQHGYDARFVGADALIGELSLAAAQGVEAAGQAVLDRPESTPAKAYCASPLNPGFVRSGSGLTVRCAARILRCKRPFEPTSGNDQCS